MSAYLMVDNAWIVSVLAEIAEVGPGEEIIKLCWKLWQQKKFP
jgi:hypothetical protein